MYLDPNINSISEGCQVHLYNREKTYLARTDVLFSALCRKMRLYALAERNLFDLSSAEFKAGQS
jgi:hypothetical protein